MFYVENPERFIPGIVAGIPSRMPVGITSRNPSAIVVGSTDHCTYVLVYVFRFKDDVSSEHRLPFILSLLL